MKPLLATKLDVPTLIPSFNFLFVVQLEKSNTTLILSYDYLVPANNSLIIYLAAILFRKFFLLFFSRLNL